MKKPLVILFLAIGTHLSKTCLNLIRTSRLAKVKNHVVLAKTVSIVSVVQSKV